MSHPLIETATFTSTVTVTDDGDDANAASINGPIGAIANRTKYLRQQVAGANAAIGWAVPLSQFHEHGDAGLAPGTWNYDFSGSNAVSGYGWIQHTVDF